MTSLAETPLLFLDCQTTGLSAGRSEILEIGWDDGTSESVQTRLLRPAKPEEIPKTVWRMTGLELTQLENGVEPEAAWSEVMQAAERRRVSAAVIHYAQFEVPFLKALHQRVKETSELPWEIVCTYKLAARLYPDLPARTIRALSGHFGFDLPEEHRSRSHVEATRRIWKKLVDALAEREAIHTWEALREWVAKPVVKSKAQSKTPRRYLASREMRLELPDAPGVYAFHSRTGRLLYVGKATSLHSRVNSYFRYRRSTRSMLNELMTQVSDVRVTVTATALEAALLENDRIKRDEPPYNSSLRTGRRAVCFAAPDLESFAPRPSSTHPWGPFLSPLVFDSTQRLLWILKDELENLDVEHLKHPPEETRAAFALLASKDPGELPAIRPRDLLMLGRKRFAEPAADDALGISLRRKLKRPWRRIHHAWWIAALSECTACFRPSAESEWRTLVIRRGQVVDAFAAASPRAVPRERRSWFDRQGSIDLPTYDRLRILWTELGTLARKGFEVEIFFSGTRTWSARAGWADDILRRANVPEPRDPDPAEEDGTEEPA